MKKWRVLTSTGVLTAAVLFACLVPVPLTRIRGRALVQAHPAATAKVYVRHEGILTKLNVRPGDTVKAGDELAVFEDRDLDAELLKAQTDRIAKHFGAMVKEAPYQRETFPGYAAPIVAKKRNGASSGASTTMRPIAVPPETTTATRFHRTYERLKINTHPDAHSASIG